MQAQSTWSYQSDLVSWLCVIRDPLNNLLRFETLEDNPYIQNRSHIVTIYSAGFEPISISVVQESNTLFTTYKDVINNYGTASSDFGDYDNDGDLDLIITGRVPDNGVPTTELYENLGNFTFSKVIPSPKLQVLYNGSVKWGDFNNDNNLVFGPIVFPTV